jgi:hypothetical protein
VATLRLRVLETAELELAELLLTPLPRWLLRACDVARLPHDPPPTSIAVKSLGELVERRMEALAMLLRMGERHGWKAVVQGPHLLLVTGLTREHAMELMRQEGTWAVARRFAEKDEGGEPLWLN